MSKRVVPFITNWNKAELLDQIHVKFPDHKFRIGMRFICEEIDQGYDVVLIIDDKPTTITLTDNEAFEEIVEDISYFFGKS